MPREFPKLKGNILVFVGKFEKKKAVYAKIADALGAKIKQELDKDVDFAVIGSGFGEKQKGQILQHNIKPMSEEQWLNWVEETINRKWLLFCWYMRWKAKRIEKLETLSPQTRKQS